MIAVYFTDVKQMVDDTWVQKMYERMPQERIRKAESLKNDAAKRLSLAAGLLLDFGLWQRGLSCRNMTFKKGKYEKPYIVGDGMPFFNISHSGTKAVCAIADTEVGVDVERIRNREPRESLIRKVCTDSEKEFFQKITSESERKEQFYKLWTVKESVMKQCGMGLAMAPAVIEAVKSFECDAFVCQELAVTIRREEDYFISVCGARGEQAEFMPVDPAELRNAF